MNDKYELYHFGILGMKWGIRRFQNEDGTLTPAGKKRYDNGTNANVKQDKKKIRKYESSWKYEANPRRATMLERERLARMNAYKEKLSGERDEYKKIARDRKETLGNRFRAYREASKIKRDIKRVEKDIEAQGKNYVLKKVLKETLFMSALTGIDMYGNARLNGYDISESGKFAVTSMLSGALETAFFAYGNASADKNNYEHHKSTYGIY